MKITGTIENIEYRNNNGHEKKVVTLCPDYRQKAYIEVRGRNMEYLNDINVNDYIEVEAQLLGQVSKTSGLQYNNIVAENIKKIG